MCQPRQSIPCMFKQHTELFFLPDSSGERSSMVHQVLKFAQDLGLEELDVKECGCLGAPSRNLRYDLKQSHTA